MTHQMEPSFPERDSPRHQAPPPPSSATKATPALKTNPLLKGGSGAADPLVGTKVYDPSSQGEEMGTVTDVHLRETGVVWVEYPGNPTLYEMAHGLMFPSPTATKEHHERVRNSKGKGDPPPIAFKPA